VFRQNTLYRNHQKYRKTHWHAQSGRGAAYTRTRRPVVVVYSEKAKGRVRALLREIEIKKLNRGQKEHLIGTGSSHKRKKVNPAHKRKLPDKPWDIIFKKDKKKKRKKVKKQAKKKTTKRSR